MTELSYSFVNVTLNQQNAFQPQLNVRLDVKYPRYAGQPQAEHLQIWGMKGKLRVKANSPQQFEIGVAEQEQFAYVRLGEIVIVNLALSLSPYLLHRIEDLRLGNDLWFQFESLGSGLSIGYQDGKVEIINFQITQNTWKYPKSEWIDHLNTTEFNRIELIEIPKIELPKISLTNEIVKFLSESNKAMNEGRYGDVLHECRKAIEALDTGIKEWGKKESTTPEQNSTNEKTMREIYLSKLIGDANKAKRLNEVRNTLHWYLSLDPHEAEYKGIEFTNDDAKFVIHTVTSFANNILKYMSNRQSQS